MEDLGELTVKAVEDQEAQQARQAEIEIRKEIQQVAQKKQADKAQTHALKLEAERQKSAMKQVEKIQQDMEEVHKKRLLKMVNRYLTTFPFLREKVPKLSPKVSLLELHEVLAIVREEMDSQRSLLQLHKYTDFGFYALEHFWGDGSRFTRLPPALRLNLTHLNEYHKRGFFQNELEPILQEIDIEYPWLGRQGLLLRSLEALSECILKTHIINTNPEAKKIVDMSRKPPKDIPGLQNL